MTWSYAAIVGLYLAGAALALRLHVPNQPIAARSTESALSNLKQAFAYVRAREVVLGLLLLAFLVNLSGFPLNNGLLPVYARDILDVGAVGLGQLLGAYSVGSMLGSVTIAALPRLRRPGVVMTLAGIGWHASILALALIAWFGPAMGVLALAGLAQSFTMVTMSMLLLSVTSPEIRGRVMGIALAGGLWAAARSAGVGISGGDPGGVAGAGGEWGGGDSVRGGDSGGDTRRVAV